MWVRIMLVFLSLFTCVRCFVCAYCYFYFCLFSFMFMFHMFLFFCFFFKQKTAYELRISDWSSDVCSSDLSFTENRNPSPPTGEGCAAFSLLPSRSWERVRGLLAHRQHRPQSPAPAPASASPPDSLRQDRAPATRAAQSRAPLSPDTRKTILSAPRAPPAPPPLDPSPAPRRAARPHLLPTSRSPRCSPPADAAKAKAPRAARANSRQKPPPAPHRRRGRPGRTPKHSRRTVSPPPAGGRGAGRACQRARPSPQQPRQPQLHREPDDEQRQPAPYRPVDRRLPRARLHIAPRAE